MAEKQGSLCVCVVYTDITYLYNIFIFPYIYNLHIYKIYKNNFIIKEYATLRKIKCTKLFLFIIAIV